MESRDQRPKAASTILVVDDIEYNRDILDKILSAAGYAVTLAGDGAEALELLKKGVPDLVLLDIRMPKASGYDVCREFMKEEDNNHVPVIFITSEYKDEKNIMLGLDMGGLYFITRPVDRGELLARVRVGLRVRQGFKDIEDRLKKLESSYGEFNRLISSNDEMVKSIEAKIKTLKNNMGGN